MNGDSRMDHFGSNRLLLDDGLNMLMDVMVDVLAGHNGGSGRGVCCLVRDRRVPVLGDISVKCVTESLLVVMMEDLVLHGQEIVCMSLRTKGRSSQSGVACICEIYKDLQCLPMLDRLDHSMVMLLVNLLINGCGQVLMAMRANVLIRDSLTDILVDGGLVLSISGNEAADGLPCFLHGE